MRSLLLACGLLAGWAAPAGAACSDAPRPKVDWLRCAMDGQNFAGADLADANLRDASFFRTDLTGASLARADGYRAKFVRAALAGAQLDGADLLHCDLSGATWIDGRQCAEASEGTCREAPGD